jgi:hypothetical protein
MECGGENPWRAAYLASARAVTMLAGKFLGLLLHL